MHKPQPPIGAEDGFDVEDEFALDVGEAWSAPDALARPLDEIDDPFEDPFGEKASHDPFAEAELPPYEGDETELPAVSLETVPAMIEDDLAADDFANDEDRFNAELAAAAALVATVEPLDHNGAVEPAALDPERLDPEPGHAEFAQVEPEQIEPEQAEPDQVELEQVELEPVASAPFELAETELAPADPAPVEPEPVQPEPVLPEPVLPEPVVAAAPAPAETFDPHAFGHAHHGELSVPRIGIHIFCESADTFATAEQSAKDRRMTRANTVVRQGGLETALQTYQNQPTPPLVIVECVDPGPVLVAKLDRLAEVCDTGTKVVVIGQHNDITLYRELMRRGVSEYLVAPLHTLQLIQAITTLYADPSAPFVGRQIAFVGARGGVGSSTVAHNLAHALSEHMQSSTAIVDFDLAFGTAGLDFNQDPLQGVVDALSQPERLDPVLLERMMVRCSDRLSLFAAPATLDHDYEISADAFEEVATKVRTAAPFIVLDLPHLWSNWMRRVLLGADEVVLTAAPDLASLRNAKNILDLLRQARPNDTPPKLVINQVGLPGRPEIPIKDFSSALGVDNPVIVPFDAKLFGQAANNGQMIGELAPRSKPAESLHMLAQLIARREPTPAPKKSVLASLFKLK